MRIFLVIMSFLLLSALLLETFFGFHFTKNARISGIDCYTPQKGAFFCPDIAIIDQGIGLFPVKHVVDNKGFIQTTHNAQDTTQQTITTLIMSGRNNSFGITAQKRAAALLTQHNRHVIERTHTTWTMDDIERYILSSTIRPGDHVIITLNTDDFLLPQTITTNNDSIETAQKQPWIQSITERSFLINLVKKKLSKTDNKKKIDIETGPNRINECGDIPAIAESGWHLNRIIMMSKSRRCWSQGGQIEAERVLNSLQRLKYFVNARGGSMAVFVTPAAWELAHENTADRAAIPNAHAIDMTGLYAFIKAKDSRITVLTDQFAANKTGNNSLFTADKGQWTAKAHQVFSDALMTLGWQD